MIAALPKFIKLSPGLVKNIFERLLVSFKGIISTLLKCFVFSHSLKQFTGDQGHSISPVSPSELLIALHNIDCSSDDTLMKATVKGTVFTACWIHTVSCPCECLLLSPIHLL